MAGKRGFGEDLLSCAICLDQFNAPKVLPCLHTFCQDCIQRHYDIYKLQHRNKLSCPTCRELLTVPPNGVADFRPDMTVQRTLEILRNLCCKNDPGSGKSGDVGAGEHDHESEISVSAKKKILGQRLVPLQDALSQLRAKILQLYAIENHIKFAVEAEIATATEKMKKPDMKEQTRAQIEESHAPSMAQLASEQDKLYRQLAELKSIYDITEECLSEKTTNEQFEYIYQQICILVDGVSRSVFRNDLGCIDAEGIESLAAANIPSGTTALDSEDIGATATESSTMSPKKRQKQSAIRCKLLYKLSGLGSEPGKFDWPVHASFLPDGGFLVCDKNNLRIQIFDDKGNFKSIVGKDEIKPRRAKCNPRDGLIYVSDETAECVKVYTLNGELVSRLGESFFLCPAGMAFNSKGDLVMTDAEKATLSIHDTSGVLLSRFTTRTTQDQKVPNPYFVAVNEDDQLLVCDFRNNCVKAFNETGRLLFTFGKLHCPRGICLDPYGNIIIAESDYHRVSMYTPYGKLIQHLATVADGLRYPMSVEMNLDGRLLVTQCGVFSQHSVLIFQMY